MPEYSIQVKREIGQWTKPLIVTMGEEEMRAWKKDAEVKGFIVSCFEVDEGIDRAVDKLLERAGL